MKLKTILRHLMGPMAPQGASWEPKGAILDDVGFVLGSFGVPNWSQKSVLEHLVGPMAPPRGPKGPLGSPRVPFWRILGSFWGHFWSQNHAKIGDKNQRFFESGFCWILVCFGVHFCVDFCRFSGLATTDREKPGYVKFVDSIEKLADFQEN